MFDDIASLVVSGLTAGTSGRNPEAASGVEPRLRVDVAPGPVAVAPRQIPHRARQECFRHGVETRGAERAAAPDPGESNPNPSPKAEAADGPLRIIGARTPK